MNRAGKKSPRPQAISQRPTTPKRQCSVIARSNKGVSTQSIKRSMAPPAVRLPPMPGTAQLQAVNVVSQRETPLAPPVYRPEPLPRVLQTKIPLAQRSSGGQVPRLPVAPPVYRPEQRKVAQPKMASAPARQPPQAPSVYRPSSAPVNARTSHLAQMKSKAAPQSQSLPQSGPRRMESPITPHAQHPGRGRPQVGSGVVVMKTRGIFPVQKLAGRGVIQRQVADMDDKTIKALSNFHALGKDKEIDKLTTDEIQQMKNGTFRLTAFHGVGCNCFGWALGEDRDTGDKGKIYNWKKEHGGEKNFTDPASASAKIILWGDQEGEDDEDKWDVLHASVKLSHAELLARSGKFKALNITKKELTDKGVPDPCWSSAGGMGFGIFVHPRDWFEGGDFGVALKGMIAVK
jgi:hypothetical protein